MIQQPRVIRFVYKAPLVLATFVGSIYALNMFLNYREDTTSITNAGFVVMASLAALSFSFARVIETDELRDRAMFSGERLLHSAILILTASILKYLVFALLKSPFIANSAKVEIALMFTVGILAAIIFSNAVLFAHTGLRVLNDLLLLRFTRHKDWDDIW